MQVQVNRRMAKGLQVGLAYTWSKAMGTEGARNRFVPAAIWNRGLQSFDQTQILVVNYQWDLPKASSLVPNRVVKVVLDNWDLSGVSTFASGTPTAVTLTTTPTDLNGGSAGQRIDVVGKPNDTPQTFDHWFNAAALRPARKRELRQRGTVQFQGSRHQQIRFGFVKNIPLGKMDAQFAASG